MLKRVNEGAVPTGWPHGVPPPDVDDFVGDAVTWLLDAAPGHYRLNTFLRKQPIILARMVCERLQSDLDAARQAWLPLSQWTAAALPRGGAPRGTRDAAARGPGHGRAATGSHATPRRAHVRDPVGATSVTSVAAPADDQAGPLLTVDRHGDLDRLGSVDVGLTERHGASTTGDRNAHFAAGRRAGRRLAGAEHADDD